MQDDKVARYTRISELNAAYAVLLDSRQAAAWADLFTEDGVLAFGTNQAEGRTALAEFAAASTRGTHLGSPPMVTEDAGRLMAHSQFNFITEGGGQLMAGSYVDEIIDDGQTARFVRRTIEIRTTAKFSKPTG